MIISFKDKDSALLASGVRVKRFEAFERIAYRKITSTSNRGVA
ncbi:MAG: hypothetical protein U0K14_08855 [Eggerthellaceae bacterium]|nr:hypothetical protein [Eggerthellaceae bacterium]